MRTQKAELSIRGSLRFRSINRSLAALILHQWRAHKFRVVSWRREDGVRCYSCRMTDEALRVLP